jgi:hypothetical protein
MVGDSISQESPQSAPTSKWTPYDPPSGELEAAIAEAHHALVESLDDDLTAIGRSIPWRYSQYLEPLITAQSIRHKRASLQKAG